MRERKSNRHNYYLTFYLTANTSLAGEPSIKATGNQEDGVPSSPVSQKGSEGRLKSQTNQPDKLVPSSVRYWHYNFG